VLRKFWQLFRERFPSRGKALLVVAASALAFFLVSAVLVVGGAAGLAWTETEKFCIGCHEMRDNVYAEYKDTIHAKNRSGVRAICSDCHVPHEPVALIKRKFAATWEVWGHLTGSIDTREKFEKARHPMAMRVWKRMKETDSLECRNCHTESAMDPEKQSEKAKSRHAKGRAEGKTCIDCHYGIAHKEPDGPGPQEMTPEIMKSISGG
jgi:cytochrome c-type protein NapC